jgi:hypothetical protein
VLQPDFAQRLQQLSQRPLQNAPPAFLVIFFVSLSFAQPNRLLHSCSGTGSSTRTVRRRLLDLRRYSSPPPPLSPLPRLPLSPHPCLAYLDLELERRGLEERAEAVEGARGGARDGGGSTTAMAVQVQGGEIQADGRALLTRRSIQAAAGGFPVPPPPSITATSSSTVGRLPTGGCLARRLLVGAARSRPTAGPS